MVKVWEKIKSKNSLPLLLFFIILLNYFPIIIKNIATKRAIGGGTKEMLIAFAIEVIILGLYLIKKIKFSKESKRNLTILIATSVILFVVQVYKYMIGTCELFDFANIICIAINIFLLYILLMEIDVEEKYIYNFFIAIVSMGIVACIVNVIIYHKEILGLLGINGESRFHSIKSFFAHRNQFAAFLYFAIMSNIMLILKCDKKTKQIILWIIMAILGINLFLTASRTGILCTAIFAGLFFLTTNKLSKKTKFIVILIGVFIFSIAGIFVYNNRPEVIETIEKNFIRKASIKNFTGRTKVWIEAEKILTENPINALFGIGRFAGGELIQNKYEINHFHNFYIESMITGGFMELLFFLFIYFTVIRKVWKSGIEKQYKLTYICLYISYAIYGLCECMGRFSMGYVDTICFIMLISIPLLHANSVKDKKQEVQK